MSGCDCYKVGGPWVDFDPDCPAHGYEAQRENKEREREDSEKDARIAALEARVAALEARNG